MNFIYPADTGRALLFLGYGESDFECQADTPGGLVHLDWRHTDPQPTEQAVQDALADATTVNGQTFSQWLAEHGGDSVATFRRKAREALDEQQAETEGLIRALALVVMDEINLLRAEHSLAARTPAQIRTAIKNKIDSGEADN